MTIDIQSIPGYIKIEILLAFSTRKRSFNPSFAISCLKQINRGRPLTIKQIACLDSILNNFQVDIDYWMDTNVREAALNNFFNSFRFEDEDSYDEDFKD